MNKVIVDKARLLRRVIVISWISLALCFVVKIFGGNFFEIMSDNPKYKALCDYAEEHLWLNFSISFVSSMYCQSMYLLSVIQRYKFTKKQFIVCIISVAISSIVKIFSFSFGWIVDIWLFLLMPICYLGKNYKKYWYAIIAFLLTFTFQFISLIVKNIGNINVAETYFIGIIYMVDVYIMCFIYYLYRNYKKEKEKMGRLWGLFAGKPVDKLKAMKAKREEKIAKLQAEVNAIEVELAKRKNDK